VSFSEEEVCGEDKNKLKELSDILILISPDKKLKEIYENPSKENFDDKKNEKLNEPRFSAEYSSQIHEK